MIQAKKAKKSSSIRIDLKNSLDGQNHICYKVLL